MGGPRFVGRLAPDRFGFYRGWFFHPLLQLLLLAALVTLIVLVALTLARGRHRLSPAAALAGSGEAALQAVRMRYAGGEIGRDEFLRVSSDLGGPTAAGTAPPEPSAPTDG